MKFKKSVLKTNKQVKVLILMNLKESENSEHAKGNK